MMGMKFFNKKESSSKSITKNKEEVKNENSTKLKTNKVRKLFRKQNKKLSSSIKESEKEILDSLDDIKDSSLISKKNNIKDKDSSRVVIGDGNDYANFGYKKPTLKDKLSKISKKQWAIGGIVTCLGVGLISSAYSTKSIKLVNENPEIYVNDIVDFDYVIEPDNAANKDATIGIDEVYFELQDDGSYKALKEGTTELTLSQGEKTFSKYELEIKEVFLSKLEFSENSIELGVGNSYVPAISYFPKNTTYPEFTLTSTDNEIVTIKDENIVGVKEGNATIKAESSNGVVATLDVTVVPVLADGIEIASPGTLLIGDNKQLNVTWNPENVTYKNVTWSIEPTNLATITVDGQLTCLGDGTVKVIATEQSNNKTIEKELKINPIAISKITLTAYEESLYVGYGAEMFVSYEPENATYKECTFASSDENVLKVNEYGYVTAIAVGTAKVTAKTSNGKTDVVTIEVKEKPIQAYSNATVNKSNENTEMVWISGSGTKYHSKASCSKMKNPWQVTKQEAIDAGRQACKKCY